MPKTKVIPYAMLRHIIINCLDKRTQALMAFQYAMGNRAGEMAKEYKHWKWKKKKGFKYPIKVREFISDGIRRGDFIKKDDSIEWTSPNFKNARDRTKTAWVLTNEKWLYDILVKWLEERKDKVFLFGIRQSRIRGLIDAELKRYNSEWSSHCLRHSRATHIAEVTSDPFVVKEILGHARLQTSAGYINIAKNALKRKLGMKSFEEVLGEKI